MGVRARTITKYKNIRRGQGFIVQDCAEVITLEVGNVLTFDDLESLNKAATCVFSNAEGWSDDILPEGERPKYKATNENI